MTLKEKFQNIIWAYLADESVKIADDYAIEFAEWLVRFENIRTKYGTWLIMMDFNNPLTTKEALELFKKEKGL